MHSVLAVSYSLLILSLGLCGLRVLFFIVAYLATNRRSYPLPARLVGELPFVTVQLPVYNEPFVVERAIDAACRLRWPADRLEIQVLDDSIDDTPAIVARAVARWRASGVAICHLRRPDRAGYKAGALAAGLKSARGSALAVFDADFVPPPDFLEHTVPYLSGSVGAVQARWGHLNPEVNLVTRVQALALDGYFLVEQVVRSRLGLFVNFNGSAAVWRREAIEAAGGWQGDSLAEDTDLAFRAQLAGWRILFLPGVVIPAELPTTLTAFRRQQRRWAIGTTQLISKLGPAILRARLPWWVRLHALLTLAGHFLNVLPLACLLASPLVLAHPPTFPPVLIVLAVLGLGPPTMYALALRVAYRDWRRQMAVYPALALTALGLSLTGSLAVARALLRRGGEFERTPKMGSNGARLPVGVRQGPTRDQLALADAVLAGYGILVLHVAAAHGRWGWAPFLAMLAAGYGLTAWLSLAPLARPCIARLRVRLTSSALRLRTPGLRRRSVWPAARPSHGSKAGLPMALERVRRGAGRAPR